MKLVDLLTGTPTTLVIGDPDVDITGVVYDSRNVGPGALFVAMPGERADGNDFIPQAIRQGAAAIVSERSPETADIPTAWARVPSGRVALADLAARFYGFPTRRLVLTGVTGTNGKTTTACLLESVFRAAGCQAALLGTIAYRGPGFSQSAGLTTPEAPDLERCFHDAVERGASHAVMEVSSHAIAMKRVWGLEFDAAVFTNLSGEHLDFHGDMEGYFATKRRLFTGFGAPPPPLAVINRDDPYGRRLLDCGNDRVLTFGLESGADVCPRSAELDRSGIRAEFATPNGRVRLSSPLVGRPNLSNIAAAVAVSAGLGIADDAIQNGISAVRSVPGRFERVERGQPFEVIVDYAHTDDALEKLLLAVREITRGKVILVFGAGGERDSSKRRRMGRVAARHSDLQILTSDNPRTEDPLRIVRMIEEGLEDESGKFSSVLDRREAIRTAFGRAGSGDAVVIAGKGHEDYQIIGTDRLPFDDRIVAAELLDELDTEPDC